MVSRKPATFLIISSIGKRLLMNQAIPMTANP